MSDPTDGYEDLRRLVENPDYYDVMDAVVSFVDESGERFTFEMGEVDVTIEGDKGQRGVVEKNGGKLYIAFDDFEVHGFHIWRVSPANKVRGVESVEVERRLVE